jgi:hypothetical protein
MLRANEMQEMIKSRRKACLHVGNARVSYPSRSGIAYFAKVGLKDDTLHFCVLIVRAAPLDDLYICDGCDAEGVPDLMRSSGKHTEGHHLIRCLAPKADDKDKASPTEERLTSIEGRLDDLTGYVGDLNVRIGNIEQLLHILVGASEDRTA